VNEDAIVGFVGVEVPLVPSAHELLIGVGLIGFGAAREGIPAEQERWAGIAGGTEGSAFQG